MSYCFIFSNIYLKIFFMIKVYGCEKNEDKKNSQDREIATWKGFCKVKHININSLFFFYSKNIFVFLNQSLILINIFSNLYFHHYYMTKKIFV